MSTHSKTLFAGFAIAAFLAAALTALARAGTEATTSFALLAAQPASPAGTQAQPAGPPAVSPNSSDDDSDLPPPRARRHRGTHGGDDRVSIFGSEVHVRADETLHGDAVGVMTGVTVDGTVQGDAVAVMGRNLINGTVNGDAVAIMGDLVLGPKAHVSGQVVCVGGRLVRDEGSSVDGQIVEKGSGLQLGIPFGPAFRQWWRHGLSHGAALAMGPHLEWMWILNACLIGFYALLALVFPGGVRKCGDSLVRRPAVVVLSSFLVLLGLPVLFILLLITIVGIPVALILLPLALIAGVLFGRAAIYALIGRSITRDRFVPAFSVIVGALACVLLYFIPVIGLVLSILVAFLGLGCVVTTLSSAVTHAPVAPPPAPASPSAPDAPVGAAPPSAAVLVAGHAVGGLAAPTEPPVLPPRVAAAAHGPVVESAAGLPRAGFWIRMLALLIDFILITVVFFWHAPFILLGLAIYGAILWKLKGSTIGGIILGLKVLRLDDRPIDWGTAFVRAFSCFFSLIVIGFGFIWIAFDREKQAWHDKIAGTVVVRSPKGVSLV